MHQQFHSPELTDEGAFRKQAEYRFRKEGLMTTLHQHKAGQPCNSKCRIFAEHTHNDDCAPDCEIEGTWYEAGVIEVPTNLVSPDAGGIVPGSIT